MRIVFAQSFPIIRGVSFKSAMLSGKIFVSPKFKAIIYCSRRRFHSSQVAVDWNQAKPYESIPGPKNAFQMIRLLGPGGFFQKLSFDQMFRTFREKYGDIVRLPGILGQPDMVMTFLPDDIETVFRTEGKNPNRRPLDSLLYFRTKLRKDLYPAGAGVIVT